MGLERVIVLLDMDCFYVQVEQREQPELRGKPCAVVQYRKYKGGGIIAVSYEARDYGVKRGFMGDDAQRVCPEIKLVRVPTQRDKAVLTKYRDAGAEVIDVLMQFSKKVERASIDEAFIDLTDEVEARLSDLPDGALLPEMLSFTHVAGWEDRIKETDLEERSKEDIRKAHLCQWLSGLDSEADRRLAVGALITEQMRAAVLEQTQFNCSAGIAHNKMLAKLSCGLNKPRKQSVLPQHCVPTLFRTLPIGKVRGLGGKLGAAVTEGLGAINMGDLVQYSEAELQAKVGPKAGVWLYSICRGYEDEPVRPRQLPKSVGCSKNFLGKSCLNTVEKVKFWLGQLSEEVAERLEKEEELNNRIAKSMSVHLRQMGKQMNGLSRSCALHAYDAGTLTRTAMSLIQGLNRAGSHQAAWSPPLVNLGVTTTKFVDVPQQHSEKNSLDTYFSSQTVGGTKQPELPCNISPRPTASRTSKHGLESYFSKKTSPESANREQGTKMATTESNKESGLGEAELGRIHNGGNLTEAAEQDGGIGRDSAVVEASNGGQSWAGAIPSGGETMDQCAGGVQCDDSPVSEAVLIMSRTAPDSATPASGLHERDPGMSGDYTDVQEPPIVERAKPNERGFFRSKVNSSPKETHSTDIIDPTSIQDVPVAMDTESEGIPPYPVDKGVEGDLSCPQISDELSSQGSSDYVQCDQCQERVSPWNLPEHLDFHVAQALHEKENGYPRPASSTGLGSSSRNDPRSGKRKAPQLGSASKKSKGSPSNKTLHSFFVQR